VWLCEPAQGAVTGEAIPVDGQQGSNAE
jgi:hypothetical protein